MSPLSNDRHASVCSFHSPLQAILRPYKAIAAYAEARKKYFVDHNLKDDYQDPYIQVRKFPVRHQTY
jgi:hypothetical protein